MKTAIRPYSLRRGRWLATGLGLLAAVMIASCSGDDGAPGKDGRSGTTPRLPIGPAAPLYYPAEAQP